jgi:hypothetical protein
MVAAPCFVKREIKMIRNNLFLLFLLMSAVFNGSASADDGQGKQAELDAACEAARQVALAPRKAEIYQECIDKFKKSPEVCEQEADGYNGNRVGGSPLFYDLPACEAAFEYQNKQ